MNDNDMWTTNIDKDVMEWILESINDIDDMDDKFLKRKFSDILNSDNTWMKIQKYSDNVKSWTNILDEYNWDSLLNGIDTIDYELKIVKLYR